MPNLSYLLIADDKIDLSNQRSQIYSLKAHIKYSLLFEEKILLSDAHILRNKNFRRLIQHDQEFLELFNTDNLGIALRDSVDFAPLVNNLPTGEIKNPNLAQVLDGFVSYGTYKYNNGPESGSIESQRKILNLFEQRGEISRYNFFSINDSYSDNVLKVFDLEQTRNLLGDKISARISDLALERRESFRSSYNSTGSIGVEFFANDLGKVLIEEGYGKDWNRLKDDIMNIAKAPYLMALPKVMDANPIYGQMHKKSIDFIRNHKTKFLPVGEVKNYNTRLHRFEEGINRLPTEKILRLRDSNEYKNFRNAIYLYSDSDASILNVLAAMEEYKNRIDYEIIQCFPNLSETRPSIREKFNVVSILNNTGAYGGLFLSGMALTTINVPSANILGLGAGMFGIYLSELIKKMKLKLDNEADLNSLKLNQELTKKGGKIIIAESKLCKENEFKAEIFYSSVV